MKGRTIVNAVLFRDRTDRSPRISFFCPTRSPASVARGRQETRDGDSGGEGRTSGHAMTIFLIAAASLSHWLLDLIVHVRNLPLYDNTAKVRFGLWRHVTLSFPLELIVLGLGAWLYARITRFTSVNGQYLYWGFVAVLAALQVYANFGPPSSSPETMAMTALFLYVTLALLAAWVERAAIAAPTGRPLSLV